MERMGQHCTPIGHSDRFLSPVNIGKTQIETTDQSGTETATQINKNKMKSKEQAPGNNKLRSCRVKAPRSLDHETLEK